MCVTNTHKYLFFLLVSIAVFMVMKHSVFVISCYPWMKTGMAGVEGCSGGDSREEDEGEEEGGDEMGWIGFLGFGWGEGRWLVAGEILGMISFRYAVW